MFKQELANIFLTINATPVSQRPRGNTYNRLRNQIDDTQSNDPFFTPQDRIDYIMPTMEQINALSAEELNWYYRHPSWGNEIMRTWEMLNNPDTVSRNMLGTVDLTTLRAISEKVFTLAERVNALPTSNSFAIIANYPAQLAGFAPEIRALYSIVFELDTTETSPSNISKLIETGHYVLTVAERAAYMPTLDEYYDHLNTAQQTAIHSEVYDIYRTMNALQVSEPHPAAEDMAKLHALRAELFSLQERINVLPPKSKAHNMSAEDKALVADEVRYIYAQVDAISDGSYPNITQLHSTAPEVLPLQELIDHLPDVSVLDESDYAYIQYVNKEAIYLRELVEDPIYGAQLPDTTLLDTIEVFFGLSDDTTDIHNEGDLKTLLNELNGSSIPTTKIGKIVEDFDITSDINLSKGTLILLTDTKHTVGLNGVFSVTNAKMNLGSMKSGDLIIQLVKTSASSNGQLSVSGETASLNLYSCVTVSGGNIVTSAIFAGGNAVVNLYGCTIKDLTLSYTAPINLTGTSTANMYDGTVIENCTGHSSGAVCASNDGYIGGPSLGAITFNMWGGTIRNCVGTAGTQYGGGAVYIGSGSGGTFNMNGGRIENCSVTTSYGGGAVNIPFSSTFNMNGGVIDGCYVNSDSGFGGGAVFLLSGGTFNLNGGTIQNCYNAKGYGLGGAVFLYQNARFTMTGGEITDCNSGGSYKRGGALYIYNTGSSATLTGGKIHDNIAVSYGGAVFAQKGALTVYEGVEIYNNISYYGGAITSTATLVIHDNARIYNNSAVNYADDVYVAGGTVTLGSVNDSLALADGHTIDGWYSDASGKRWECYISPGETPNEKVSSGTYSEELALKAAHPSHEAFSFNAPGRRLDMLTADAPDNICRNGAISAFFDFTQTATDWYLGSTAKLPAGTKLTLIYYPDGTASSAVYYHFKLNEEASTISLQDFERMGGGGKFARTDSNAHFFCQICVSFPSGAETNDDTWFWLADTPYAEYFPNVTAVQVPFDGNSLPVPGASLALGGEQDGRSSISVTATVSELDGLSRAASDPGRTGASPLSARSAVLAIELLDASGKKLSIPSCCTVKVNGSAVAAGNGIASLVIAGNGSYAIVLEGLPEGDYKIRVSLCAVQNASHTSAPMADVFASAVSTETKVVPERSAIRAELSTQSSDRVFASPSAPKTMTFRVQYVANYEVTPVDDIAVKILQKAADGTYSELSWSAVLTPGASGSATVKVTVPADADAGTYRVHFTLGTAEYNYNLIITTD